MEGYGLPPIVEDANGGFDEGGSMSARPRVTTTRESVYGWYPPQWNVYAKPNYKQLDGYDKECLYKNWYNAYKAVPGAKAPAPPGMGRPPKSPPPRQDSAPVRRSTPSFRLTRPMSTINNNSGQSLKRQLKQREEERRLNEQELRVDSRCSPARISTPDAGYRLTNSASQMMRNSWHFDKEPEYVIRPLEGPDPIPKPYLKDYGFRYGTPDSSVADSLEPHETRPRSAVSPTRPKIMSYRPVRSATVRRPKFPSVPDMEKFKRDLQKSSASSTPAQSEASVSPAPSSTDTAIPETNRSSKTNRIKSAPPTCRSPTGRPEAPTPNKEAPAVVEAESSVERPLTGTRPETAEPVPEKDDSEMTYEELVDKYGWKVQIPGDPLHLKRNIIRERGSFSVTCSAPDPPKDPPKVHREVWDTFFLNTIPRKPATFTIAPDWISEVLHAKRIELQKREGINYRYKDFAFVY